MNNQKGFGILELILTLVIVGIIGFVGWRVYEANQEVPETTVDTNTITQIPQGSVIPQDWTKYENNDLGITFRYPSSWGKASFEIMNPQPDELNKTFYKISFESKHRMITITPKDSLQTFNTTVTSIKESITDYPGSRHVVVNKSDYVAIIASSTGNQGSELYAAKFVSLPKIDADTMVLTDFRSYGSSVSCKADTYVSCYTDADQSEIKLFFQELKAE